MRSSATVAREGQDREEGEEGEAGELGDTDLARSGREKGHGLDGRMGRDVFKPLVRLLNGLGMSVPPVVRTPNTVMETECATLVLRRLPYAAILASPCRWAAKLSNAGA